MRLHVRITSIVLGAVLGAVPLRAQSTQSQGGNGFPLRIHGFLLGNYTARTNHAHPPGKEGRRFLWADERLRLETSGDTAKGHLAFLFKGDLFHDAIANTLDGVVREAYFDYSQHTVDLRVGRQIVTWGVGDLLFINDVFPKDWNAFFSGRPLEYLKVGVDAAKLHVATPAVNAEMLVIPFFEPDNLPQPQRFFFFDPFARVTNRSLGEPVATPGNTGFALRLYGRIFESDVSIYASRNHARQPSFRPDQLPAPAELRGFYPRQATYGVSGQRNVGAALLNLEAGYYDSQDDRSGADPAIPNSQFRFLAGYQRQLGPDFAAGAQYYTEIMNDFSAYHASLPAGLPAQDRFRHLLTLRLTRSLKYQTWRLSLFSFYSPSDQDALLIPEVWHAVTDRLSLTLGANVFEGQKQTSFLGQWDRNDNVYVAVRFDF